MVIEALLTMIFRYFLCQLKMLRQVKCHRMSQASQRRCFKVVSTALLPDVFPSAISESAETDLCSPLYHHPSQCLLSSQCCQAETHRASDIFTHLQRKANRRLIIFSVTLAQIVVVVWKHHPPSKDSASYRDVTASFQFSNAMKL